MKALTKSVVVGLSGGLGNQLFQYAAGRALSLKLGVDLLLDTSWFFGRSDRAYALDPFAINANIYSGSILLPNWITSLESRLSRRWGVMRLGIPIYREPHFHFDDAFSLLNYPVFLEGYWQSERYFLECKETLTKEFSLRTKTNEPFKLISNLINSSDAICIHIRRGDYVTNPITSETHGLCSIDYIYRGVKVVSKDLVNPHCFIFSDDLGWAKENIVFNLPYTFVDVAKSHQAHLDLELMTQCKHFVIANSSLSWWGAWLSPFPLKRIVAPINWFASSQKRTDDLIPQSWQRL